MPILTLSSGARLSYGETGAGPTLVMVHGSPGDGRAWANVIKHLSGTFRILTPDLPGYGGSDPLPPGSAYRTEAMASAIGEWVASLDGPIWLCGHSYGANVALHTAVQWRDRINGIILLEPVFLRALQLAGDAKSFEDARAFFAAYLVQAENSEHDAIGIMINFWCGAGFYEKLPSRTQAFLNSAAAKNAVDVRASFAETTSATSLGNLNRPTTIAFGDQSPKIAEEIATSLKQLLPQALTSRVRGATHLLLDTHPAEVANLIAMTIGQTRDGEVMRSSE